MEAFRPSPPNAVAPPMIAGKTASNEKPVAPASDVVVSSNSCATQTKNTPSNTARAPSKVRPSSSSYQFFSGHSLEYNVYVNLHNCEENMNDLVATMVLHAADRQQVFTPNLKMK
jgi:hypothetical protein